MAASKKTAAKKTAPTKTATTRAATKRAATTQTATTKAATTKTATTKTATTKTTARKPAPKQTATTKAAVTKPATKKAAEKSATATKKRAHTGRESFASGASRAAAERRTASPLLRATAPAAQAPSTPQAPEEARLERRLHVVPEPVQTPAPDTRSDTLAGSGRAPTRTTPRLLDLVASLGLGRAPHETVETAVTALAGLLRVGARAAGLPSDEVEAQVARTLAYLRRRTAGDYTVDEFGFDEDFTQNVWLPLLRPLYHQWFRVEVRGVENIPATGGALLVANHSGTIPVDGLMTQVAVHDEAGRYVRMLGADLVFELPFVGTSTRRSGGTLATAADAERLLGNGELVGVYPEGFKGVGKPFSERYKLQRFGRGGFVSAALRTGAPIIPCSIIGAEEIYPLIGDISILARLIGAPYFPVTPFFPLLGPLGLIPLPSKWIIAFGEPLDTSAIGAAGAEDPMLVFDLTDQVRETIQQTLYSLLMQRRSVFF